jgi:hypothetical protein
MSGSPQIRSRDVELRISNFRFFRFFYFLFFILFFNVFFPRHRGFQPSVIHFIFNLLLLGLVIRSGLQQIDLDHRRCLSGSAQLVYPPEFL